jgi:hypothetical protein
MIKKLESAGLGYHVSADETEDKLGMMVNNNHYQSTWFWYTHVYRPCLLRSGQNSGKTNVKIKIMLVYSRNSLQEKLNYV